MEFCQVQNSLCVRVLHSPILAALLHFTVEAYLHIKWHLDPFSHLATIDMGQKLGEAMPPFWGQESWVPI